MAPAAQTFVDGTWHEGNPPLMGPMTLATWLGSVIFDGARAFEGTVPDLDLHCRRAVASAAKMNMKAPVSAEELVEICRDGVARFPAGSALYIKPLMWAEDGWIYPDPDSTRFAVNIFEAPLPAPSGSSCCVARFRRPAPDQAPTDAKSACLYPNQGRALREAHERGFDNAVVLDPLGNVAEFATANIFLAKDGVIYTPIPNGTFLDGLTRQRCIALLRGAGETVIERAVTVADLHTADEIWSTGNHAKLLPMTRFEDHDMQTGPLFTKARDLYWEFAHSGA
ncbi:MAG: branched-chain amino acid aminotransferase [Pseudomonadota bacterium]|nr:branched-chain amino acid aminotransferase [Pseudomonadota bacterium]